MLQDIIYWTYRYLPDYGDTSLQKGILSDALFVVSLCIFINLLTVTYVLEHYTGWSILQHIPIRSRRELTSWLSAILLLLPIVLLIYSLYFRNGGLDRVIDRYNRATARRQTLGKLIFWAYQLLIWGGFIVSKVVFAH